MSEGRLLPLSALARQWGWSVSRLHRLVKAKQIPHLRIGTRRGGDVFFEEAAIEAWLAAHRVDELAPKTEAAAIARGRRRSVLEECEALGIDPDPDFMQI